MDKVNPCARGAGNVCRSRVGYLSNYHETPTTISISILIIYAHSITSNLIIVGLLYILVTQLPKLLTESYNLLLKSSTLWLNFFEFLSFWGYSRDMLGLKALS